MRFADLEGSLLKSQIYLHLSLIHRAIWQALEATEPGSPASPAFTEAKQQVQQTLHWLNPRTFPRSESA